LWLLGLLQRAIVFTVAVVVAAVAVVAVSIAAVAVASVNATVDFGSIDITAPAAVSAIVS
jgi:hypothetical protein